MPDVWIILIPIVAIVGGCLVAITATMARARVREAEIRERIAMIERGLVPAPEVDPRGFERAMGRFERHRHNRPIRFRRSGVVFMAIGLGLMMFIGVAGDSAREGVGVGGGFFIFGLAFFISSFFDDPVPPTQWEPSHPPPAFPPSSSSSAASPRSDRSS
jgi:hypothetical protein